MGDSLGGGRFINMISVPQRTVIEGWQVVLVRDVFAFGSVSAPNDLRNGATYRSNRTLSTR